MDDDEDETVLEHLERRVSSLQGELNKASKGVAMLLERFAWPDCMVLCVEPVRTSLGASIATLEAASPKLASLCADASSDEQFNGLPVVSLPYPCSEATLSRLLFALDLGTIVVNDPSSRGCLPELAIVASVLGLDDLCRSAALACSQALMTEEDEGLSDHWSSKLIELATTKMLELTDLPASSHKEQVMSAWQGIRESVAFSFFDYMEFNPGKLSFRFQEGQAARYIQRLHPSGALMIAALVNLMPIDVLERMSSTSEAMSLLCAAAGRRLPAASSRTKVSLHRDGAPIEIALWLGLKREVNAEGKVAEHLSLECQLPMCDIKVEVQAFNVSTEEWACIGSVLLDGGRFCPRRVSTPRARKYKVTWHFRPNFLEKFCPDGSLDNPLRLRVRVVAPATCSQLAAISAYAEKCCAVSLPLLSKGALEGTAGEGSAWHLELLKALQCVELRYPHGSQAHGIFDDVLLRHAAHHLAKLAPLPLMCTLPRALISRLLARARALSGAAATTAAIAPFFSRADAQSSAELLPDLPLHALSLQQLRALARPGGAWHAALKRPPLRAAFDAAVSALVLRPSQGLLHGAERQCLICPITQDLLEDPVLLVGDGRTYSRAAISRWLRAQSTSPCTGEQLAPSGRALVTNWTLKGLLAQLEEAPAPNWPPGAADAAQAEAAVSELGAEAGRLLLDGWQRGGSGLPPAAGPQVRKQAVKRTRSNSTTSVTRSGALVLRSARAQRR